MRYWKISDYYSIIKENRILLQRIFFSLALISLGLDFYYHIFISQIGANPILYQEIDPVYLLFMQFRLPQFISGNAAPYFDAALVLSCIAALIWPRNKLFPILFFILHFNYFITYNMLAGHHYISIGLVIMSCPFIFYNKERFAGVFTLCRFVFCFMMFSAACWKIFRGNLWHMDQANMLLISAYTDELVTEKPRLVADCVRWLISHRPASHALWCILILLEGVFAAGFITFKWDRILLISYLLFFAGGWIIFNIYNYDNLLFLLTLTPVLHYIALSKPFLEISNKPNPSLSRFSLLKTLLALAIFRRTRSKTSPVKIKLGKYILHAPDYQLPGFLIKEKFIKQEYYFKADDHSPVIIDCGSSIGISIIYFKSLYPDAKIYCIEPYIKAFGFLEQNIRENELQDIQTYNNALSDKEGITDIHIPSFNDMLNATMHNNHASDTIQSIQQIKLSNLIADIKTIDLIKIDTEGAEHRIIDDLLQNNSFNKSLIKKMIIEYHFDDQNNLNNFIKILKTNNYEITITKSHPENPDSDLLLHCLKK